MPVIPVNLSKAVAYEDLPHGTYLAQIDSVIYKPTDKPDKFDQLMVKYTVIEEGSLLGKTVTEWLSLSPKATGRLKKWFSKFGEENTDNFNVDDDTDELTEPDIAGYQVIILSYEEVDKRKPVGDPDRLRTRVTLVSVEDEIGEREPAATAAAEDDEEEEAPAEEKPRAAAQEVRKAAPAKPARRTLR
jgi:hypothetical protein